MRANPDFRQRRLLSVLAHVGVVYAEAKRIGARAQESTCASVYYLGLLVAAGKVQTRYNRQLRHHEYRLIIARRKKR